MALEGPSWNEDFNPPGDRLRSVSDTGQNLRHNVNAGGVTVVDDPLDYPPATPVNAVGSNALGVTGSAYSNNDLDASTPRPRRRSTRGTPIPTRSMSSPRRTTARWRQPGS